MASKLGDFFVNLLLPTLATVGTQELVDLLQQVKTKNEAGYKSIIEGVYPPLKLVLEPITAGTKTRVDDTLVGVLVSAIEQSAALNNYPLPDVTTPAS